MLRRLIRLLSLDSLVGEPNEFNIPVQLISRLEEAKDWFGLEHLAQSHLASHKTEPLAWCILGESLLNQGRFLEAESAFRKATTCNPKCVEGWLGMASLLAETGNLKASETEFRRILEISPEDEEAWYNLGVLLRRMERWDEALEAFRKALKIKKEDPAAWFNLGLCQIRSGDEQGLQKTLDTLERLDPAAARSLLTGKPTVS